MVTPAAYHKSTDCGQYVGLTAARLLRESRYVTMLCLGKDDPLIGALKGLRG
jgi:hypothetical protein